MHRPPDKRKRARWQADPISKTSPRLVIAPADPEQVVIADWNDAFGSVFDARLRCVGHLLASRGGFRVVDRDGLCLGDFASRREACEAIAAGSGR